jgi:hypothetical protein
MRDGRHGEALNKFVVAGLDPATPLNRAKPCHINRDRRVKPGDDV